MPRQLPVMSGNFDNPRASDGSQESSADQIIRDILDNTRSPEQVSPSGELYRFFERFHRARAEGNRSPQQNSSLQVMSSEPDLQRRRRLQNLENSPLFTLPPQSPATEQPSRPSSASRLAALRRGRPRITPSDRYLDRQRALAQSRIGNNENDFSGLADLRDAGRQLEEASNFMLQDAGRQLQAASSDLRALLDDPLPTLPSPARDSEYPGDENNRRVKRRRLDSDGQESSFAGFSYGRYGQVEPGKLKMEIVSCDGGIFEEERDRAKYAAENVLRNDSTVYCTKANRCNLILRHQGGTVFSLKELVIKAPHSGYTAPVQEGMVFISMTADDLLTRTAQYQIQYSPPRPRRLERERSPNELPPILSIRHNSDGSMSRREAQARAHRLYRIGMQDQECDYRTAQIPSDFTSNSYSTPFQVITESSDSEDEESAGHLRRHRSIHRIMNFHFDEMSSSDDDDNDQNNDNAWQDDYTPGPSRSPPLRRRDTASNITLAEAAEASQIATQEAVRAVGGGLMAPHARFFIERDKSKCTVKFDPPVSGRFILLKMWSPHHSPSGNIDIQTVAAKGFAGPRYFPAINLQ